MNAIIAISVMSALKNMVPIKIYKIKVIFIKYFYPVKAKLFIEILVGGLTYIAVFAGKAEILIDV